MNDREVEMLRSKYKEITNKPNADDVSVRRMKEVVDAYNKGMADAVGFVIDEFNHRTVCLGRATAKTYVINTLNEILKELKERK